MFAIQAEEGSLHDLFEELGPAFSKFPVVFEEKKSINRLVTF